MTHVQRTAALLFFLGLALNHESTTRPASRLLPIPTTSKPAPTQPNNAMTIITADDEQDALDAPGNTPSRTTADDAQDTLSAQDTHGTEEPVHAVLDTVSSCARLH